MIKGSFKKNAISRNVFILRVGNRKMCLKYVIKNIVLNEYLLNGSDLIKSAYIIVCNVIRTNYKYS